MKEAGTRWIFGAEILVSNRLKTAIHFQTENERRKWEIVGKYARKWRAIVRSKRLSKPYTFSDFSANRLLTISNPNRIICSNFENDISLELGKTLGQPFRVASQKFLQNRF